MKFTVKMASWTDYREDCLVNTIEDLVKLSHEHGDEPLIIYFDDNEIIIYNDWVE